tara:strand:+ start:1901 stop:2413 length:513 start_codon:yes stop_codon:yes gene_type:complete
MKMKYVIISVVATFILTIFAISLNRDSIYSTEKLIGKKIENFNSKDFYTKEIRDSKILKIKDFSLINYWASWCAPCRVEHSELMQLSKKENLNIIGINFKDKKNEAEQFLKELGNPYDHLLIDQDGRFSINLGVYGIPESILLNKELKILKKFIGPLDNKRVIEIIEVIQ